jgi:hypothetical protein
MGTVLFVFVQLLLGFARFAAAPAMSSLGQFPVSHFLAPPYLFARFESFLGDEPSKPMPKLRLSRFAFDLADFDLQRAARAIPMSVYRRPGRRKNRTAPGGKFPSAPTFLICRAESEEFSRIAALARAPQAFDVCSAQT